jgi:hypothetical protein
MTEKPVGERDFLILVPPTPPEDESWRTREPLVPPEVDLHDFPYMPLDIQRLLTSETWIRAAGKPIAHTHVTLWCESWRQIPAASLPDKDFMLARYAMMTVADWTTIQAEALADWIKCRDGRWYHPVVAELAIEAWDKSRRKKFLTTNARTALRQKREAQKALINAHSDCNSDSNSLCDNPRREGKGREHTGALEDRKAPEPPTDIERAFQEIWLAFPSRRPHPMPSRAKAMAVFATKVKAGADPAAILEHARSYAAYIAGEKSRRADWSPQFVKQITTWLNTEPWTEPVPLPVPTGVERAIQNAGKYTYSL